MYFKINFNMQEMQAYKPALLLKMQEKLSHYN